MNVDFDSLCSRIVADMNEVSIMATTFVCMLVALIAFLLGHLGATLLFAILALMVFTLAPAMNYAARWYLINKDRLPFAELKKQKKQIKRIIKAKDI